MPLAFLGLQTPAAVGPDSPAARPRNGDPNIILTFCIDGISHVSQEIITRFSFQAWFAVIMCVSPGGLLLIRGARVV